MGAQEFQTTAKGKTAREAFLDARQEAQWENGHGGYTGTIAEKDKFKMIPRIEGTSVNEQINLIARRAYDEDRPDGEWNPFNDKWGPAGCIEHEGGGKFTFFGIASS